MTFAAPVRVRDLLRRACTRFAAEPLCYGHGQHDSWEEAQALVLGGLGLPWAHADAVLDAQLLPDEVERLGRWIEERVRRRVPVAYLTGRAHFADLDFEVDPRVLVPRSPIGELLLDGLQPWLGDRQPGRILDLCCGSGCIGIAALLHLGADRVTLADLSADALEVARRNVVRHGVGARAELQQGDLWSALPAGARFDLVLCNPPYVPTGEVAALPDEYAAEPALGLDGGGDGLELVARVLQGAGAHLADDGLLMLEVGATAPALARALGVLPCEWPDHGAGIALFRAADLRAAPVRLLV